MMRRELWLSATCLCLWAHLSFVNVARATPAEDEAARRHFESGRAYFERAEYDDAVREYEKSYALSLRPPLLVNISRAHESAGRPAEAAEALERWLSVSPPDDPMRSDIESRHKRLRAQADKIAQEATTPVEPAPVESPESEQAPLDKDERSTLGPWLLIGGGTGALAGGVVVALLGRGEISDVEDAKQGTRWNTVKDKADSGPRKVVIGSVVGGLGAAAAAAGVLWLLMGKPTGETQAQVSLSPEGVHVWGRF